MTNFHTDRVQEISEQKITPPAEVLKTINKMGLDTRRYALGILMEDPTHTDIGKTEKGYVLERIRGEAITFMTGHQFYMTVQKVERWLNCPLFN